MLSADNFSSNILFIEEDALNILGFIDVNRTMTKDEISKYIDDIVRKNTILRQYIIQQNGQLYLENDVQFDIKKQYSITDESIISQDLLNSEFQTKSRWFISFLHIENKTRIYIKVDHALVDGHQLIKVLTSPFIDEQTNFGRTATGIFTKVYYWIIGTILLLLTMIKFIMKIVFHRKVSSPSTKKKTTFIKLDSFSLDAIKKVTFQQKITINDFMYAVMLKSYASYTKKTSIYTMSPINTSSENTNNVCPLLLNVTYSDDNVTLLKNVHETFNCCKYSLFVPLLSFILQMMSDYMNPTLISFLYGLSSNSIDVVYSNVIGPDTTLYKNTFIENIDNISFVMSAKPNQLCYNMISCRNKLNLMVSFEEGFVTDESFLKRCINDAYTSLLAS